ncbi:MAG: hypothetical protein CUN55_11375 [Phototrophicales bacterium]|nr:MAG: hypothetical protein CUN55_11375 [Phototrophicales bacterium]
MLHLLGYNVPTDLPMYRPYPEDTTLAKWITLVGFSIAIVGPLLAIIANLEKGWIWTLFFSPLIIASGPALWWLLYTFKQQAGIILTEEALIIRQPIRYFNRIVPYSQIGICGIVENTIAIIWLKERPTAVGDEPRPPKIITVRSIELEDVETCYRIIEERFTPHPDWTFQDLERRISRRAISRRMLLYITFPILSFILVFLLIRIIFAIMAL